MLLADHEWLELWARDEACPFVQDLWANSKLQALDMDVIDFPDRSQLRNSDANLLIAAFLHNTNLSSLTTSWDSHVSKRNFGNAVAAIGGSRVYKLEAPVFGRYNLWPIYGDVEHPEGVITKPRKYLPSGLVAWSVRAHWKALGIVAHVEDPCCGYGAIG
jgi:hypothetical protein